MTITFLDATHVRRAIPCAGDCDAWKQLRYFAYLAPGSPKAETPVETP
jgi:hypothetical protein